MFRCADCCYEKEGFDFKSNPACTEYTSEGTIIYDKMKLLPMVRTEAPHLVHGHFVITESLALEYLNQLDLGQEFQFDEKLLGENNEVMVSFS